MAVNDVRLWHILSQDQPEEAELLRLLGALARETMPNRWAFLGCRGVRRLLSHPAPALRAAAIRCYAGARGVRAWPLLLAGCADPDASVRHAAREAFQVSAGRDPARWVHLLLSEDRTVIPWALEHLPRGFPRQFLFPLLAEPEHREQVLRTMGPLNRPRYVALLLAALDANHLSRDVVVTALGDLPWESKAAEICGGTRPTPAWPEAAFIAALEADATTAGLLATLHAPELADPHFDRLFELSLEMLCRDDATSIAHRLLRWAIERDQRFVFGHRIAASIIRVVIRCGRWTPDLVAFCGSALPALLEYEGIPEDCRAEGIARMRQVRADQGPAWWSAAVSRLFAGHQFCRADGAADLARLSGFPLTVPPWGGVVEDISWTRRLVAAVSTDPDGTVSLLHRAHDWRATARQELARTVAGAWTPGIGSALAEWSLSHPITGMAILDELPSERQDEVRWLILSRLADDPGAIAPRECALLAEEIARRLTTGTVLDLLATLDRVSDPQSHTLGRRLLHAIASHDMLAWALEEHPWEIKHGQRGPLDRRQSTPVRVGKLLQSRGRKACLDLLAGKEAEAVVELCMEEREILVRLHPDALTDALKRYLGKPCRGVIPAILNRPMAYSTESAGVFWALLMAAHDPAEMLFELAAREPTMAPVFSRDEIKTHLAGFTRWSLPGAILAFSNGFKEAETALCAAMRQEGESVASLLLTAFQQPSRHVVDATLEVAETLCQPSHSEDGQSGLAVDDSTVRVIRALLGWVVGEVWQEPTPAPNPRLERVLTNSELTFSRIEDALISLLPREAADEAVGLAHRLTWGTAEGLRRRERWERPGSECVREAAMLPEQLRLGFGGEYASSEFEPSAALWSERPDVVLAGVTLLEMTDPAWAETIVTTLTSCPPPPCGLALARVVGRMPPGPWVPRLQQFLRDSSACPEIRTCCGLSLWTVTGREPDGFLEAIERYRSDPIFSAEEWARIFQFIPAADRLLDAAVRSAEQPVYEFAVRFLLGEAVANPRVVEPLRVFLNRGTSRAHELRLEVAQALLTAGCRDGLPVLLAARVDMFRPSKALESIATLTEEELESVVDAAVIVGPDVVSCLAKDTEREGIDGYVPWLPLALSNRGSDRPGTTEALLTLVTDSADPRPRAEALRVLRSRGVRHPAVRQLADLLRWGTMTGLRLTGNRFTIELLSDDEHGYTWLNERRIYVNPLPLLRGNPDGARILQGLIVHELGHHVYHTTSEARAVDQVAQAEGLAAILNLVQDEQMERALRARDAFYGDCFSALTAHVFRHSTREVPVEALMGGRGGWPLHQLIGLPLSAARERGHVRIDMGRALQHLEARGNSVVRFVRALRMGLGDRHGDPRVAAGLALFGNGFRHSTAQRHLEISRKLRALFADEIQVIELLQLDILLPATAAELLGSPIDGADVRAELGRLLGQRGGLHGKNINRGTDEDFKRLDKVVALEYAAAEHNRLAVAVRGPATELRQHFVRLGLGVVPERLRVRGSRLDRSRLGVAIAAQDARILIRRLPRPTADLFLGLLVDCSGSMASDGKIERGRLIATMVAEACRNLPGIDLRIFGFTDEVLYDAGTAATCAAHAFTSGGGNNDAGALWHAAGEALESRRSARLLLMVSDGSPSECTVESLATLVRRLGRRHGLACAQVAVEPLTDICFPDYVEVCEQDALSATARFGNVLANLCSKTVRRV